MYVSAPETILTMTGPACVCHGNRAPGWTVYRTTAVWDGLSALTTMVSEPVLILIFRSMSSTKVARPVRGSPTIGGGGSSANVGRTLTPTTAAAARIAKAPLLALTCLSLLL